ncbi:MAG: sigma 54-interacting transcriptional regulator, partial [Pseudomonadota bacterium]
MLGPTPQLIGESPAWLEALEHASRVAPLDRPLLVIGERGTGKELVGERLHFLSRRWEGPFVKVNCAALSEELLDSELFGHERGAFTGATDRRAGRFELADGGTLFLDEIATASRSVQEKLLRVIEYGEFQRLGGEKVLITDVRVIAATNGDLPSMVEAGEFRADLLDRLAFDVITLPPLRVREGDASLLADFFARRMAIEMGQDFPGFAPSAIAAIEAHDWPGNVRELRNFAQRLAHRAIASAPGEPVRFDVRALDPFDSPWRPEA